MKRKIERISVSDSPSMISKYYLNPGTTVGKIIREDGKEFTFIMILPGYQTNNNSQSVFVKFDELNNFCDGNFEQLLSDDIISDESIIYNIYVDHYIKDKVYVPILLKLSFEEWCSLLSDEQLKRIKREIESDISSTIRKIDKLEREIKKSLSYKEIVDNELSTK